ncbi:hypothetical protein K445DRAFT_313998 [Daldinia sp. EC12]|nr:hypothetical protein F4774DRAFT_273465 [Daldinia eschscholtzii]OTB19122.1 hypothetical protein K445DRAFT_313998 [Daldinia sp. EC12]
MPREEQHAQFRFDNTNRGSGLIVNYFAGEISSDKSSQGKGISKDESDKDSDGGVRIEDSDNGTTRGDRKQGRSKPRKRGKRGQPRSRARPSTSELSAAMTDIHNILQQVGIRGDVIHIDIHQLIEAFTIVSKAILTGIYGRLHATAWNDIINRRLHHPSTLLSSIEGRILLKLIL